MENEKIKKAFEIMSNLNTDNMTVTNNEYYYGAKNIKKTLGSFDSVVHDYIDIVKYARTYIVSSGAISRALEQYEYVVETLSGVACNIGTLYSNSIYPFLELCDENDKYLYDDDPDEVRDYSKKFEEMVISSIKDKEKGLAGIFHDLDSKIKYNIGQALAKLGIIKENNAEFIGAYAQYIGDTKKTVRKIFKSVRALDPKYAEKVAEANEKLKKYNEMITKLNEIVADKGKLKASTIYNEAAPLSQAVQEGNKHINVPTQVTGLTDSFTLNNITYDSLDDFSVYAMKQGDYNLYAKGWEGNVGCTATAWAIGKSINEGNGTKYNPESFWVNEECNWSGKSAFVTGDKNILNKAYEELQQGKASVYYGTYKWGPHAVTIVGVREGADKNNLTENDFLVVDPYDGKTKNLGSMGFYKNQQYTKLVVY